MIKPNEVYEKNFKKVKEAINFKNKRVVTSYMGQSVPGLHTPGITMADYTSKPYEGVQHFIDFVNRINEQAPVDSINNGYPGFNNFGLATAWWSHIKMPGAELPENSVWQVEEKRNMEESDYDLILEKGVDAFTQQLYPRIIGEGVMADAMKFMADSPKHWQLYADSGYPLLTNGFSCPPFETLCGGRGINDFFMDCYKRIDKVKAVQDVMMEGIRNNIRKIPQGEYMIGAWVGGWRGASAMVNQKIWDTLVWPYMRELAELVIEQGLTPIMHLDSSWDRDIERFKELPKQKFIINTDGMTDLREARKKLGDHAALLGDVPVQMLAVASVDEVKEYCRNLMNDIGTEGLILCPGCDAPANSRFENLVAMYEAAQEF